MTNEIGKRLVELMDYLGLTYNEFAKSCGFSNYIVLKRIVTGETKSPNLETLNKIRNRYPVSEEWLFFGKGEMWNEDYFEKRFLNCDNTFNTPAEKMNGLLEIFETKINPFSLKTKVPNYLISQIRNGLISTISNDVRDKIIKTYKFIPESFFN